MGGLPLLHAEELHTRSEAPGACPRESKSEATVVCDHMDVEPRRIHRELHMFAHPSEDLLDPIASAAVTTRQQFLKLGIAPDFQVRPLPLSLLEQFEDEERLMIGMFQGGIHGPKCAPIAAPAALEIDLGSFAAIESLHATPIHFTGLTG